MLRTLRSVCRAALAAAALAAAGAATADSGPEVRLVSVTEVRTTAMPAPESAGPGLVVHLRVHGLTQPVRRGRVVVTEAVDDTGTDLTRPARRGRAAGDDGAGGQPIDVPAGRGNGDAPLDVRVSLGLSDRRARAVRSLKGELRLTVGGRSEEVLIPGLPGLRGRTVDHPVLAKAGLTVQVAAGPAAARELTVMASGDGAADALGSVVDADGRRVSGSATGSSGKSATTWTMDLSRPLRDTDRLRVTVPVGQKPVAVPFHLTEVELP